MPTLPSPLDESDRTLFREYAGAVTELLSALDDPGGETGRASAGHPDLVLACVLERVRSLTTLQEHSLALRARVLARVRAAIVAERS